MAARPRRLTPRPLCHALPDAQGELVLGELQVKLPTASFVRHPGRYPFIAAIPSMTKPMWPTDENAMSRLTSVCARQHSEP